MSDRPMHTVPGAFQKLQQLYAEGEALVEQDQLEEAIEKFTAGIAIDDHFRQRYVTMYAQRAFAHQKLGHHSEAIEDYTKAIAMEPDINQAQYFFHRGMCRAALDEPEAAVEDYGRSIAIYPDHPGPYHLRAKLYVNVLDKFEEAVPDLDTLLSMRPVADGCVLRGFAHYQLKHFDLARADFQKATELRSDPYDQYMLACIAAGTGDHASVVAHAKAAIAADAGYKESFKTDEEFAAYRSKPDFAALLG